MMRWLALLLLLMNALLLLWYAQQQTSRPPEMAGEQISRLRLLHELGGGETLQPRAQECYQLAGFASRAEADTAAEKMRKRGFNVDVESMVPVVLGYRLRLPRPAGVEEQLELLDRLALAGWVPQTRGGDFVLGPFMGEDALQQVKREREAIRSVLKLTLEQEQILDNSPGFRLQIGVIEGQVDEVQLARIVKAGWPGIKVEKKSCKGVAQPQSDQ
ncbi:SPOR domain-containing protein [Marinobacterium marinum]|uniref:SPOR domain-containing protein n=1 Tax=Marinobacterium marinum TaxID=2756129 RepID=A0A7W1WWR2_9GAMM|nr:SPOR domain-containing protein [Marinobacterium marinum]MBA4501601.1 SPOR domain-containing protein [Marinobacterium marinum]